MPMKMKVPNPRPPLEVGFRELWEVATAALGLGSESWMLAISVLLCICGEFVVFVFGFRSGRCMEV
jgi:hypothetical protein